MTLDEAIFTLLSTSPSATNALVGARVYPVTAAQGVQTAGSYVVFQQIASDPKETHGITDDAEDTLDETTYQFSCYAATLKAAKAIRRALRSDLLYPGALTGRTVCSPVERTGDEPEVAIQRADLDLTFFHNPLTT